MNKTLNFFCEIAKIPRCSGHESKIAKYLCDYAKIRNLNYFSDCNNNVVIKKQTKNCSPIIVQAHTDMVCVKSKQSNKNFLT